MSEVVTEVRRAIVTRSFYGSLTVDECRATFGPHIPEWFPGLIEGDFFDVVDFSEDGNTRTDYIMFRGIVDGDVWQRETGLTIG